MSKSQIFLLFLLSVVFGLAAVFFAKQWMDNQVQPTIEVEQVERHPVVVASQEIEAGTIIEEQYLTMKLMEVDWINEKGFQITRELHPVRRWRATGVTLGNPHSDPESSARCH